jgi:hypothetical protein
MWAWACPFLLKFIQSAVPALDAQGVVPEAAGNASLAYGFNQLGWEDFDEAQGMSWKLMADISRTGMINEGHVSEIPKAVCGGAHYELCRGDVTRCFDLFEENNIQAFYARINDPSAEDARGVKAAMRFFGAGLLAWGQPYRSYEEWLVEVDWSLLVELVSGFYGDDEFLKPCAAIFSIVEAFCNDPNSSRDGTYTKLCMEAHMCDDPDIAAACKGSCLTSNDGIRVPPDKFLSYQAQTSSANAFTMCLIFGQCSAHQFFLRVGDETVLEQEFSRLQICDPKGYMYLVQLFTLVKDAEGDLDLILNSMDDSFWGLYTPVRPLPPPPEAFGEKTAEQSAFWEVYPQLQVTHM